mmetsp:Transcript_60701/g.170058  ORF Transcript_60701/g.170058 Transcript_60701/m.170058 type:complete len:214 (-) Transcript_60701:121-762(-)
MGAQNCCADKCGGEQVESTGFVSVGLPALGEHTATDGGEPALVKRADDAQESVDGGESLASGDTMQDKVKAFLRAAVVGSKVTLIKGGEAGEAMQRLPAIFQVSRDLQSVHFLDSSGDLAIPLVEISDIFTAGADGKEVFPKGIADGATEEELHRLLRIVCQKLRAKPISVCFLEASPESQQVFLHSMRALHRRASQQLPARKSSRRINGGGA